MSRSAKPYDVTANIIAYEEGELGAMDTLKLFAYLVKTGLAWQLQGCYGRAAAALIERGLISKAGVIDLPAAHALLGE